MDTKIAKSLKDAYSLPGVKRAWLSDIKPLHPGDCPNCGGMGFHALFVSRRGPFKTPAGPYSGFSSKYENGFWWAGTTFTAACPVCGGDQPPRDIPPGE